VGSRFGHGVFVEGLSRGPSPRGSGSRERSLKDN